MWKLCQTAGCHAVPNTAIFFDSNVHGDLIYSVLKFSGADRESFLQGQLTQDVTGLGASGSLPAAWCSPKGRVVVTGRLIALPEALALVLPDDMNDTVARRLGMYRLRAKVDIARDDDVLSLALPDDALPRQAVTNAVAAVRLIDGVTELHGSRAALDESGVDLSLRLPDDEWRKARIAAGLVDIGAANSERYTPHMLNLDRTGALSFTKGCYTGQEVVARTEHLGRVKRRVMRFGCEAGSAAIGDRLLAAGDEAGTVVNAAADELLAVVSTADTATGLTINGSEATPLPLPYSID